MPDIDELLRIAAREPSRGPDLPRVATRARTLRRRGHVARGTVLVLAALIAVPLLRTEGRDDSPDLLEQLPTASATPAPVPSLAPSRGTDGSPLAVAPASRAGSPSLSPAAPAQPSRATATPKPEPEPTNAATAAPEPKETLRPGYPPADSCNVSTTDLTAGESRSCRFTATAEGGWRVKNIVTAGNLHEDAAEVLVERDGRTYRYLGGRSPTACGNDVIEPGDIVTVTVRQTDRGYRDFDLAAGAPYDCFSG